MRVARARRRYHASVPRAPRCHASFQHLVNTYREHSPPSPGLAGHQPKHDFLFFEGLATTKILSTGHGMKRKVFNQLVPGITKSVMVHLRSALWTAYEFLPKSLVKAQMIVIAFNDKIVLACLIQLG